MKNFNLFNFKFSLVALVLFFTVNLTGQSGKIIFSAHLVGSQEVPPVAGNGEGLVTVLFNDDQTKMYVQGVVSRLSGPVASAHIHTGNFGENGSVLVNLATIRTGNKFAGEIAVPAGFLQKALNFGLYVNVHTTANSGGEIRGQLELESDFLFPVILSGVSEVPSVSGVGIGLGLVTIVNGLDKILFNIKVNGLSGPITSAHIHKGQAGANGPVVQTLTFSGNTLEGELAVSGLPSDFFSTISSDGYYVNVHTAANPNGEIRGQLQYGGDFNAIATLNGAQETPPVTTSGSGIAFVGFTPALDSILYFLIVNELSGLPTSAHVHKGAAGSAGPVVFPLTSVIPGRVYSATLAMSPTVLTDLINNNLYFNVHTAANPGGEIRGQIVPNFRKGFAFDLCGNQEIPKNNSVGYGAGMVSVDRSNRGAYFRVMTDGMSGPATSTHIHTGVLGVNGNVKFPLATPNVYNSGVFLLTSADVALMDSGGYYMNIHSAAFPGGEIRGQVGLKVLCSSASSVNNEIFIDYKIFPNPAYEGVTLRFTNNEAFTGQMRMTDITGRVILKQAPALINTGVQELYMPMDELSPGVYYLYLENNGRIVLTQPVVKI